jgi:chitinase
MRTNFIRMISQKGINLSVVIPLSFAILFIFGVTPVLAQKKVVGYAYATTSISKIDFTRITHLNLAFENPDNAGNLSYHAGNTALINAAHANNVKVQVSIGGAKASNDTVIQNRYFNLIKPANRAAFISKIVEYINTYNFDGIDVDLEGSSINSDYSGFVIALKNALPNKLVTAALSHTNNGGAASSAAVQAFDFLNVMAYDRGWGQAVHHSTFEFAVTSMEWWIQNRGAQPDKLVLGVPFYGYNNTTGSGYRSYSNIINTYGTGAANQDTWSAGGNIVYYNGVPTIRKKSQLVVDKNYGGIMIWELSQDLPSSNSLSLLNNIQQVLGNSSCQPTVIQPYISVNNGNLQPVTSVSLSVGGNVIIAPLPLDGTWKWTGPNGFTSALREITISNIQSNQGGNYVATYTNLCGEQSTLTVTISVTIVAFSLTIEAENYSHMSGVMTEPCSEGGLNIGWFDTGDWISYAINIPSSGTYNLSCRVASIYSGKTLRLEKDAGATLLGTVTIPNTGSWQVWTSVSHNVTLPAGNYTLGMTTTTGGLNINKFTISNTVSAREAIEEIENDHAQTQVYPNPLESSLNLAAWPTFKGGKIKIMNLAGKEYISKNINAEPLDVSQLPAGIYVLHLIKGKQSLEKKFMKK